MDAVVWDTEFADESSSSEAELVDRDLRLADAAPLRRRLVLVGAMLLLG